MRYFHVYRYFLLTRQKMIVIFVRNAISNNVRDCQFSPSGVSKSRRLPVVFGEAVQFAT